MSHYHVQRHREDDNIIATRTRVNAFECAAEELEHASLAEYERISVHGEAKEYEDAYNAFTNYESWENLAGNLANLVRQSNADPDKRAPHYRHEPQFGHRWTLAADHITEQVNAEGPDGFHLYACDDVHCAPGAWVISTDGQSEEELFGHCDFEEAWRLYVDTLTTWANNSDDAYDALIADSDDPDFWGNDGATVASYLADTKMPFRHERDHSFELHANDGSTVLFSLRWDTEADPNQ